LISGDDFRRIALSFEGTVEAPHFDRAAFKVARIYATMPPDAKTANVKLSPDEQEFRTMLMPEALKALDNAWGRQGWTTVRLAAISEAELRTVLEPAWADAQTRTRTKK
jgi:hypothetical protein